MIDRDHLQALSERHLDGIATKAELAELDQALTRDPTAADLFVNAAALDAALGQSLGEERARANLSEVLARATRPRARRRRIGWLAAAAVFLAMGGTFLVYRLSRPGPPAVRADETVEVLSGRVMAGKVEVARVPLGERVEVAGDRPAVLRLADGSRTELAPASAAVFRDGSGDTRSVVELLAGDGKFRVAKSSERFRVQTQAGTVTALGTEFAVAIKPPERNSNDRKRQPPVLVMTVEVSEGEVEVRTTKETARLRAGDRQSFTTERKPDLVGKVVRVVPQSGAVYLIELALEPPPSDGKIVTVNMGRWTRTSKPDGRIVAGESVSVWLEAESPKTAVWVQVERPPKGGK